MKSFTMTVNCDTCGKAFELTQKYNDEKFDESDMYVEGLGSENFCPDCQKAIDAEEQKLAEKSEVEAMAKEFMPCGIATYGEGCGDCTICQESTTIY